MIDRRRWNGGRADCAHAGPDGPGAEHRRGRGAAGPPYSHPYPMEAGRTRSGRLGEWTITTRLSDDLRGNVGCSSWGS